MKRLAYWMRRLRAAWSDAGRKPLCRIAAEKDLEPWTDADRAAWRSFLDGTKAGKKMRTILYAKVCADALGIAPRTEHEQGAVAGMSEMLWTLDSMAAVKDGAGEMTEDADGAGS